MSRIPQAMTQRTKKRLIELLCSRSTAPLSGKSAPFSCVTFVGEGFSGLSSFFSSVSGLLEASSSGCAACWIFTVVADVDLVVVVVAVVVDGLVMGSENGPDPVLLFVLASSGVILITGSSTLASASLVIVVAWASRGAAPHPRPPPFVSRISRQDTITSFRLHRKSMANIFVFCNPREDTGGI